MLQKKTLISLNTFYTYQCVKKISFFFHLIKFFIFFPTFYALNLHQRLFFFFSLSTRQLDNEQLLKKKLFLNFFQQHITFANFFTRNRARWIFKNRLQQKPLFLTIVKKNRKRVRIANKQTNFFFLKGKFKMLKKYNLRVLKSFFHLKYTTTAFFQNYLKNFLNKSIFNANKMYTYNLIFFLTRALPLFTKKDFSFFIKNQFLLKNFKPILNFNTLVKINDFFSFQLNKHFFNFFFYWMRAHNRYLFKLRKRIYRLKFDLKQTRLFSSATYISKYLLKSPKYQKFFPLYIEWDFLSTSFFVVTTHYKSFWGFKTNFFFLKLLFFK